MRCVDSRCCRCNSPGEALHVDENGATLQRPVPENSEVTNRRTHTQGRNTSIIIIDLHVHTVDLGKIQSETMSFFLS